eukprot:352683-Chlamydomonas_euryale.AAC.3
MQAAQPRLGPTQTAQSLGTASNAGGGAVSHRRRSGAMAIEGSASDDCLRIQGMNGTTLGTLAVRHACRGFWSFSCPFTCVCHARGWVRPPPGTVHHARPLRDKVPRLRQGALDWGSASALDWGSTVHTARCCGGLIVDGGIVDGGIVDGGIVDGGIIDGGIVDGGIVDGGIVDGGIVDGGGACEVKRGSLRDEASPGYGTHSLSTGAGCSESGLRMVLAGLACSQTAARTFDGWHHGLRAVSGHSQTTFRLGSGVVLGRSQAMLRRRPDLGRSQTALGEPGFGRA